MIDDADRLRQLGERLGYEFGDLTLLRDALTHRSLANERPQIAPMHNERLEYLGDAVAQLVASHVLYERFGDAREGELTRRRADLVCEAGLAEIARRLDLGAMLRLGNGEERTGGREKPRLLASALEACLAAIYLDGGPDAAARVARALFAESLEGAAPGASDYKSRIQELVQAAGMSAPTYRLVRTEGPDHDREFFVEIEVGTEVCGEGEGKSKVEAEQVAAERALKRWSAAEGA